MVARAGFLIALAAQCLLASAQTYLSQQTQHAPFPNRYDAALVNINWAPRHGPADWRTMMIGGAWGPDYGYLVGGLHYEYQHFNDVWVTTTVNGEPTWTMLTEFTGWTPVRGAKMAILPLGKRYSYKVKTNNRYEVLLHIGGTMEYYPTNEVWSSYDKGYSWELLRYVGGDMSTFMQEFTYPRYPHAFQERSHHGLVIASEPRVWNPVQYEAEWDNKWGISVACAYIIGGAYERPTITNPFYLYFNDVWTICPNSNKRPSMQQLANPPWSPRSHFGITAYNEGTRIVIAGGKTGQSSWTNEVWSYDVYRRTWAQVIPTTTFPTMHQPHLVVSGGPPLSYNIFYILGSQINEDDYTTCGSWASVDLVNWIPIPAPIWPLRRGAATIASPFNNRVMMVGGTINGKPFQSPNGGVVHNFTFFNDVWTSYLFN